MQSISLSRLKSVQLVNCLIPAIQLVIQHSPPSINHEAAAEVPNGDSRSTVIHPFAVDDITLVICLRSHVGNPWVLERLRMISEHYEPRPRVLICDFGSERAYASEIQEICRTEQLGYLRVEDYGVYSPAIARNRAFEAASTDLLFFCDIDTFGRTSLFAELATLASNLGIGDVIDLVLAAPILHLSETDTAKVILAQQPQRSAVMDRLALEYLFRSKDSDGNAFVAPYSNNFLINRKYFDLVGGYDERFRGHGSEDFEFFLRLNSYSKHLPLPGDAANDKNSPMGNEFYEQKDYTGFRRLLEAQSYPAEHFGLRVFHLWHPRNEGAWTDNNDWKRTRFNDAVGAYLDDDKRLLSVDSLARSKSAICICTRSDEWEYLARLRLSGFRLFPLYEADSGGLDQASQAIADGQVDALAYMKDAVDVAAFKPLLEEANKRRLKHIAIMVGGQDTELKHLRNVMPLSASSYISARIGMPLDPKPKLAFDGKKHGWGLGTRAIYRIARIILRRALTAHEQARLDADPISFFRQAKWRPNQFLGRLLLEKSQRPY